MTETQKARHAEQDDLAPFGTTPRRSKGPIVALGVIYALWFVVLCWMAAFHIGW